jgi:class 3 adenylate cyclase/predicted ATPase
MDCGACGASNPDGKRFCGDCAAPLPQRCGLCGAENPPGKRFCGNCAASLTNLQAAESPSGAVPLALPNTEFRQVSVMFCDLVGSTALSSRLDPEDYRDVMMAYQERVAAVVEKFDGFIACYQGDGVLIYFGWPAADEADAERAVRAGLAMIEAVCSAPIKGQKLQVRVGIATGPVIIGDLIGTGSAQQLTVLGETPNLASRLQTLAEPETVVICLATRVQIGGLFDCRDLGPIEMKGFDRPLHAWRVLAEASSQDRFKALRSAALMPLVGRDDELHFLLRRWEQVKQGDGRCVLISGEPGIGKSRLIASLTERLSWENHTHLRYFCSPHHQDSALYPVIGQLEHAAAFERDEPPESKLDKLKALLVPTDDSAQDLALIADLLSLPVGGRASTLNFSPKRKRDMTLEALHRQLGGLTKTRPILTIIEDAHWSDPSTIELLGLVVNRLQGLPVLLIVTYRPEFNPPWINQMDVVQLTLSRLGRRQAAMIASKVSRVAGTVELPDETLDRIVDHADGVPLFIEELTRSVMESGGAARDGSTALAVPRTLQASLMARLDRLPTAKQIAQVGAVIGRRFTHELLTAVAPMSELTLQRGLDQLVASGLVAREGDSPHASYLFKHALVQDAAYESLLRSSRSVVHAKIVDSVRKLVPDAAVKEPALLGHHCAQAGLTEDAAKYYRLAGEQSIARSALAEARAHLERGLQVLTALPDDAKRRILETDLLLALGSVLVSIEGHSSLQAASAIDKAVLLSRGAGDVKLMIRALFGEWSYKSHTGDLAGALAVAEEMVSLGYGQKDPVDRIVASTALGMNYAFGGRFTEAMQQFQQSLAELNAEIEVTLEGGYSQDHEVLARSFLSLQLACLGFCNQSDSESGKSIERARRLRHLPSLAVALTVGCRQAWLRDDVQLVYARATELATLCEEQGFPYWLARAQCYVGWSMAAEGCAEEGLTLLNNALSFLNSAGIKLWNINGLLADAYARAGERTSAIRHLDEALGVSSRTGEVWADAELHRLKGEILAAAPALDPESAERHFIRALEIARSQSAKLWELRSAISLARLLSAQDKRGDAYHLLASVRDWFVEGRSVPCLAEADLLLGELNPAVLAQRAH